MTTELTDKLTDAEFTYICLVIQRDDTFLTFKLNLMKKLRKYTE